MSYIDTAFDEYKSRVLVKQLSVKVADDKLKLIIDHLKTLSVKDATSYCQALLNAIDQHKYKKFRDTTISDLEMVLLD